MTQRRMLRHDAIEAWILVILFGAWTEFVRHMAAEEGHSEGLVNGIHRFAQHNIDAMKDSVKKTLEEVSRCQAESDARAAQGQGKVPLLGAAITTGSTRLARLRPMANKDRSNHEPPQKPGGEGWLYSCISKFPDQGAFSTESMAAWPEEWPPVEV